MPTDIEFCGAFLEFTFHSQRHKCCILNDVCIISEYHTKSMYEITCKHYLTESLSDGFDGLQNYCLCFMCSIYWIINEEQFQLGKTFPQSSFITDLSNFHSPIKMGQWVCSKINNLHRTLFLALMFDDINAIASAICFSFFYSSFIT